MQRKKAISEIVSTVLIIMIAVAAVGIIGAIVVPMVRDSLGKGTACLNALSDVSIVTQRGRTCIAGTTCINKTGTNTNSSLLVNGECSDNNFEVLTNISVQVSKGPDVTVLLGALNFVIGDDEGNSKTIVLTKEDETMPDNGGVRTYILKYTGSKPTDITLAPSITVGNSLHTCDASSSNIPLTNCI